MMVFNGDDYWCLMTGFYDLTVISYCLFSSCSKEIRLESYCQLLETFSSVLGHADLGKVKAHGEGQSFPGDHWTIRDTLLLLGNICLYSNDLENLQSVNSILRVLKLEMASLVGSNLLPSSSNKLHNKVSRDLDNSRTQQDSEEMKKVIEHTLKLLIRWSPSYLLSTQSTETSLPLCTGVITVGLWFLEQSRNVISGHILELIVDWLHSALMSSDVLIKVLLECPKKSQMMLEGLIGLYPNLNNCILGANKMAVAMQGKINVTDTVFVSEDSRLEIMKKLNAMVCCLCEQRVGAKQKKWKEFLSRYKKLSGHCLLKFTSIPYILYEHWASVILSQMILHVTVNLPQYNKNIYLFKFIIGKKKII